MGKLSDKPVTPLYLESFMVLEGNNQICFMWWPAPSSRSKEVRGFCYLDNFFTTHLSCDVKGNFKLHSVSSRNYILYLEWKMYNFKDFVNLSQDEDCKKILFPLK